LCVQQGVTVVHFTETKVVDQRNINQIGSELVDMVQKGGVLKMLINMENVRYLSSAVLGKLKLCGVAGPVYKVFELTRFNRMLDMHETEVEALGAFWPGR